MNFNFLKSVFLQFSGIVGAGIFTLPFLFHASNYYFALIGLIIISLISSLVNYFYIDIVTSTVQPHQLAGYAQIYLGRRFKSLAVINLLLICLGSLFVYHHLAVKFLLLFFPNLTPILLSIIFFLVLIITYLLSGKISLLALLDFLPALAILIVLVLFSLVFDLPTPALELTPPNLFFLGAVIFAINGFTVIPQMPRTSLYQASFVGLCLATLVYIIFSFSIIKLSGSFLSIDSLTGLFQSSPSLGYLLAIFGILVTFKGSLTMLRVLFQIFHFDFQFKPLLATFTTLTLAIFTIAWLKLTLIETVSLLGSITTSLAILIICFIRLRLPTTSLQKICLYFVIFIFSLILLVAVLYPNLL